MSKSLAFMHEGTKYIAVDDVSADLLQLIGGSHICSFSTISSSPAAPILFKRELKMDYRMIPMIKDYVVEVENGKFKVAGVATFDGKEENVLIHNDGILVGSIKQLEPEHEPEVETLPEETVPEAIEEAVEIPTHVNDSQDEITEEVIELTEETTVENTVEEIEDEVEEEVQEEEPEVQEEEPEVQEEEPEVQEEEPEVQEEEPEVQEEQINTPTVIEEPLDAEVPVVTTPASKIIIKNKKDRRAQGLIYKESTKPKRGIKLGAKLENNETVETIHIGRERRTRGISFPGMEPTKPVRKPEILSVPLVETMRTPTVEVVSKPAYIEEPTPVYEEHAVVVQPEYVVEKTKEQINAELAAQLIEEEVAEITKKWDVPVPITKPVIPIDNEVAQEVDVQVHQDNKALKEALRATFSPEINEVIGNIPVKMLGAIAEFTMNPIDVKRLEASGDMYCIDNRWHRCGKWYCIDVTSNNSRYFWNSKMDVSIEIPMSILKEWQSAVS